MHFVVTLKEAIGLILLASSLVCMVIAAIIWFVEIVFRKDK